MAHSDHTAKLGWLIAAALVAAGVTTIVIGLLTPIGSASFGWFAYQPLADATFTPGASAVLLAPVTVAGWAILVVGLITFAFLAGRVTGRRSHR